MNDYGFELLSDEEIPIEEALEEDLFSTKNLIEDIYQSNNFNQMTEKRFCEYSQHRWTIIQRDAQSACQSKSFEYTFHSCFLTYFRPMNRIIYC